VSGGIVSVKNASAGALVARKKALDGAAFCHMGGIAVSQSLRISAIACNVSNAKAKALNVTILLSGLPT